MTQARRSMLPRLAALLLACGASWASAEAPRTVTGLVMPESVLVGADGRIYVSEIGGFGKDGDGRVSVIDPAKGVRTDWATTGLNDPKGLAERDGFIYVADNNRVLRIDRSGKVSVFAAASAFPKPPKFFNDLAFDAEGNLYVSDSGDLLEKGGDGVIYRLAPDGKVTKVVDEAANPAFRSPNGLLVEAPGKLLVVDFHTGELVRLDIASGRTEKLADGFGGGDGLALGADGRLIISDWANGIVWSLDLKKAGAKPVRYPTTFQSAADITLSADGRHILVPDMKAGTLVWLPK